MSLIAAVPLLVWNLAADDGGFTSSGSTSQWEWAVPTVGPGGVDPAWCTRADGVYLNDAVDDLQFILPDVSNAQVPRLELLHWFEIQPGDGGTLQAQVGGVWVPLEPIFGYLDPHGFSGSSGGWQRVQFDLTLVDDNSPMRLRFDSDDTGASDGWFVAEVGVYDGDVSPPQITPVTEPQDTDLPGEAATVEVEILDDSATVSGDVVFQVNGGPESRLSLLAQGADLYAAAIPGQPLGSVVDWWVEVTDGVFVVRYPDLIDASYSIALSPPEGLFWTTPETRVAQFLQLDWQPPSTSHAVLGYRLTDADSGVVLAEVETAPAFVPLDLERPERVAVIAQTDVGDSPPSAPIDVPVEIPSLEFVTPSVLYQQESRRVLVQGSSLYLSQSATSMDAGAGVQVVSVEVVDATSAELELSVDVTAETGWRPIIIDGPEGRFLFEDAFEVRQASDGPRVVSVTPKRVEQGASATIEVVLSEAPASDQLVTSSDPVIFSTTPPVVEGSTVSLTLVIERDAPEGIYALLLDDGARFWPVPIEVVERRFGVGGTCAGCATTPNGEAWGIGLILWVVAMRRRREVGPDRV